MIKVTEHLKGGEVMEAKRIVTLPEYGDVLVEYTSRNDFHDVDIWRLRDGVTTERICIISKSWCGQRGVPVWDTSDILTTPLRLTAQYIDAYIALLKLAQEQAEALDREFVPGSEVN